MLNETSSVVFNHSACNLYDQNNYFGDFPDFFLQDELAKMTLINIGIYQRMKYKVKKKNCSKVAPPAELVSRLVTVVNLPSSVPFLKLKSHNNLSDATYII